CASVRVTRQCRAAASNEHWFAQPVSRAHPSPMRERRHQSSEEEMRVAIWTTALLSTVLIIGSARAQKPEETAAAEAQAASRAEPAAEVTPPPAETTPEPAAEATPEDAASAPSATKPDE